MKLITFSLWGDNPKYTVGAIRNATLTPLVYPGWKCRFYVGTSVPNPIIWQLEDFEHVEIVRMKTEGDWRGTFWRFYPASEDGVEVMISRDTDSRISKREAAATKDWITSDKGFHIMRDHPWHGYQIMAGMCGIKKNVIPNMKEMIDKCAKDNYYQVDQDFLREIVWPIIRNDYMCHDEFFEKNPFPKSRNNLEFVGEVYDETNMTIKEHTAALKRALANGK